jgi:hypothetical protein
MPATTVMQATEPAAADPRFWDSPTLDTAQHLANSLGEPLELPDSVCEGDWATEQEPALLRWFARLTHKQYVHQCRDNTYNGENDLSSNFVFSIYAPEGCSDWCWCDDLFVVVECHLGGDVRGNYGPMAVYRIDSIGESGFFDVVCGWYAEPVDQTSADCLAKAEDAAIEHFNERCSIGYSGWPTGEARNLIQGEPVWSDRLGCYIGRIEGALFPVKLHPCAPYYC